MHQKLIVRKAESRAHLGPMGSAFQIPTLKFRNLCPVLLLDVN